MTAHWFFQAYGSVTSGEGCGHKHKTYAAAERCLWDEAKYIGDIESLGIWEVHMHSFDDVYEYTARRVTVCATILRNPCQRLYGHKGAHII